jgi:tRNA-2-methylthio-N6-dimethylallyladenosine synthase
MAECEKVCEHIHFPLQSGSDRILRAMQRSYRSERYLSWLDRIRQAISGVAVTTDIIVGFPGETDEEFQATLELMRTVRFHDAYTYKYSLRDGTPATRLPEGDFLPPEVAQERLSTLIDVSRAIQAEINATEVGRVVEILVEKEGRSEGHMMGRSRRNKVVVFPAGPGRVGEYVDVTLERTTGATFVGSAVDSAVVAGTA